MISLSIRVIDDVPGFHYNEVRIPIRLDYCPWGGLGRPMQGGLDFPLPDDQ